MVAVVVDHSCIVLGSKVNDYWAIIRKDDSDSYRYVYSKLNIGMSDLDNVEYKNSKKLLNFIGKCNRGEVEGVNQNLCQLSNSFQNVKATDVTTLVVCDNAGSLLSNNTQIDIEYTGTNPQEADEIVKQIKLE